MKHLLIIIGIIQCVAPKPQFLTFKDGKVGVNFLGYYAEAGLGGGQRNGLGLLGGLRASAGTPWGQRAAAGLGGNVNDGASGLLYAGAQATPDTGASAALGGDTARGGVLVAESHNNGRIRSVMNPLFLNQQPSLQPVAPIQAKHQEDNAIQKIPKKHESRRALIEPPEPLPPIMNDIKDDTTVPIQAFDGNNRNDVKVAYDTYTAGDVVRQSLQIPIGILQSVQESLSGLKGRQIVSIEQEVTKP